MKFFVVYFLTVAFDRALSLPAALYELPCINSNSSSSLCNALINESATSVCKISSSPDILRISAADGPLIYKYKSDGMPVIRYPSTQTNCIFQSEVDQQLHLACPGINSTMQFYQKVGDKTRVTNATSRSVYLMHDPSSSSVVHVHGGPSSFVVASNNYIKCSKIIPLPAMHLTNVGKGPPKMKGYEIGYRLNDIDLLKVCRQEFYPNLEIEVIRIRIPSVINKRLTFGEYSTYERGVYYQNMRINYTEIFSREYQIASFQKHYKNLDLTVKYFAGNNSVVVGKLIFKEDLYYYGEQEIVRYYENTAPIWKSVYEGNWRTIGRVIREIADETTRDLDVSVTYMPSFLTGNLGDKWVLGNTTNSPDYLPVAEILVKAAIDVENPARGIVFHTFNDPHLNVTNVNLKNYCLKNVDCNTLHPVFDDAFKGYTFCCLPEDSSILINLMKER